VRSVLIISIIISSLWAQDLKIGPTETIHDQRQGSYYFPVFSADGAQILFTTLGFSGLWSMDWASREIRQVSNADGSGYMPIPLKSGAIIFREDTYIQNLKYSSYKLYDPRSEIVKNLVEPGRFLSAPQLTSKGLHYLENGIIKLAKADGPGSVSKAGKEILLFNDMSELRLLIDGSEQRLTPRGSGTYIWSKLSPSMDKILFTKVGEGTYVCDLEGVITAEIGFASAGQWSPDGKFIVYMKETDDGKRFTHSEIWIATSDGSKYWQVTQTPDTIEMYPQWSPRGDGVVYHTVEGTILKTHISITE
jgi:hypothetical protein